jgi:hypothetical protein
MLKDIALGFGWTFATLYATWFFYLAAMNLIRAKDAGTLSLPSKILGWPIVVVGITIDMLVNLIIMTVLLLEIPKEWLVTARLSRHIKDSTGFRKAIAVFICTKLLDTFDPSGTHCH